MPMMWMAVRVAWCLLTCLSFSVTPCTAHRLRNGEDLSWGDQSEQPIVFHHDISDTFLMYEPHVLFIEWKNSILFVSSFQMALSVSQSQARSWGHAVFLYMRLYKHLSKPVDVCMAGSWQEA
ncbi:uncharacterized protein LOC144498752 isoform X2 [Mustelus asterias]